MRDNYLHIKSSLLMPINACKHALLCNLMTHEILKVTYSKVDVLIMCVSATMAQNGQDALFASPRYLPAVLIIRVVTGKYSRLHMYNAMRYTILYANARAKPRAEN